MPGERAALTQPFLTKPPPFERQGFSEDDLIDFTPELRAEALELLADHELLEFYEPPTMKTFAYLPGALGGANWHGAAFDPETGFYYVPSITWPGILRLVETGEASDYHLIHDIMFALSMGFGPQGLPGHLGLPRLGWQQRGAPLLTRTLLFVGQEARNWMRLGPLFGGALEEEGKREFTVFIPSCSPSTRPTENWSQRSNCQRMSWALP